MLEYANELTSKGYVLDEKNFPASPNNAAGFNPFGRPMVLHHPDRTAIVRPDPALADIDKNDNLVPVVACDQNVTPACKQVTVSQNHWAHELEKYKSVPDYLWQAAAALGYVDWPSERGIE